MISLYWGAPDVGPFLSLFVAAGICDMMTCKNIFVSGKISGEDND